MEKNVTDIAIALAQPFPQEMEKTIVKSGVELVYLPISEVIARLNKVLGVDGWSSEVISVRRDEHDVDEITAHVALTAYIDGKSIRKEAIGGQSVKRQKRDNKPVDLGNDFKGAVSDALKKAAQQLGIGLYLARTADALDAEDAIESEATYQDVHAEAPMKTEADEQWDNFVEIMSKLTKEQKDQLNVFWNENFNGKPKPTKTSANPDEIKALIVEALRLQFGGTYVEKNDQ